MSKSAGHSLKMGYAYYDLRDRRETEDFVVSQNFAALQRFHDNHWKLKCSCHSILYNLTSNDLLIRKWNSLFGKQQVK